MKTLTSLLLWASCLAAPGLSFAQERSAPQPKDPPCTMTDEQARFNCKRDLYHNKANTQLRVERRARKKAAMDKAKKEKVEDTGEGQFKAKF